MEIKNYVILTGFVSASNSVLNPEMLQKSEAKGA